MSKTKDESKKTTSSEQNHKLERLETTILQIEKEHGKGSIMRLGDKLADPANKVPAISTRSLELDLAIGIGGVPRGRIIEIFGPESAGKTTLALHIVAEAQKAGGMAAFIDAEHALNPEYAVKIGVDINNLFISQPNTGEEGLEICEALVRSGTIDVIVVDSVAALVPKAEIDGDMGDAHMGLQARLMSQAMRKLAGIIAKSNTCVIFINQIRCIHDNSLIITSDGIKRARSLEKDNIINSKNIIYGKSGNKIKINNIYYSNIENGIIIHSKNRGRIITGLDHKFPIIKKDNIEFITSKNLQIGNFTIHPILYNIITKPYLSVIDWVNNANNKLYHNSIKIKLPEILDENLAMFLGMYYADGSILYDIKNSDYRIQFTENNRERYKLVKKISIELFGDRVQLGNISITIGGRQIVEFILSSGIGKNSPEKIIPDKIMNSNSSVLKAFIKGAFFDTHGFNKYGFIFTCENENSLYDFNTILYSMGIFSDICKSNKNKSKTYNRLYITGEDAVKFSKEIGFLEFIKQNKSYKFTYSRNARGKYDIIPSDIVQKVFKLIRNLKIKGISSVPGYNNIAMIYYLKQNASRKIMISFLSEITKKVDNDYINNIYKLCKENRFSEIISLEPISNINTVDLSVSAKDELFIAETFLTHNSKIGVMFGSPETTTGGNALKFYSSVRLDIRRIETLKAGDEPVGIKVRVKVLKNKVAPPFKQAEFDISFDKGIMVERGILDVGVNLGFINKAGAWYSYGEERMGQGRDNAAKYLVDNPAIMLEVKEKIMEYYNIDPEIKEEDKKKEDE